MSIYMFMYVYYRHGIFLPLSGITKINYKRAQFNWLKNTQALFKYTPKDIVETNPNVFQVHESYDNFW